MKKIRTAVVLLFALALLGSCKDTGVSLDPAQLKMKADSILQAQSVAIRDSANAACQQRMQTEVAAKADSLAKVKLEAQKTEETKK